LSPIANLGWRASRSIQSGRSVRLSRSFLHPPPKRSTHRAVEYVAIQVENQHPYPLKKYEAPPLGTNKAGKWFVMKMALNFDFNPTNIPRIWGIFHPQLFDALIKRYSLVRLAHPSNLQIKIPINTPIAIHKIAQVIASLAYFSCVAIAETASNA
jgi:hypothetical protein